MVSRVDEEGTRRGGGQGGIAGRRCQSVTRIAKFPRFFHRVENGVGTATAPPKTARTGFLTAGAPGP